MHVSILIPVFNSELTIADLCTTLIRLYVDNYNLQIVLVNDGSSDNSDAVCRNLQKNYPAIVSYVLLSRNFGEHNAVMAGLHYVKGDVCVIMDDDFQNPPEEVVLLIKEIELGYDVVFCSYAFRHDPWWRDIGSRLHNLTATLVLDKPIDLYLSSFKVINRFVIDQIITYSGPEPYIDALILRTTRNFSQVSGTHQPRKNGISGYSAGKLLNLWGSMFLSFSIYPLRALTFLGMCMCVAGIFFYLETFVHSAVPGGIEPDSFLLLKADLWLFRGVQLFATGLVAEYVGRIFRKISMVPQYIVRDHIANCDLTARTGEDH